MVSFAYFHKVTIKNCFETNMPYVLIVTTKSIFKSKFQISCEDMCDDNAAFLVEFHRGRVILVVLQHRKLNIYIANLIFSDNQLNEH